MRMYIEPDIIVVTMEETVDDFFFAQTKKNWKEKIMRWKNVEKVEKNTMEQNDMDWSDNIDSFH